MNGAGTVVVVPSYPIASLLMFGLSVFKQMGQMFGQAKRVFCSSLSCYAACRWMQTGSSDKLHAYYTDRIASKVAERYKIDFETFGYSTDLA